ncbi:MAG TPA: RNA polymerase sigma factor [Calditrichia bacterium]|nr:RNA polymerase sigma factor [Calditrichia bacterium]
MAVLDDNRVVLGSLLERIQSGDREAEADLFHQGRILDRIRGMCYAKLSGAGIDAEDVAADIALQFIACLREGRYQPERARLGSFLYGISRNKLREYYRGRHRLHTSLQNEPGVSPNPTEKLEEGEVLRQVRHALLKLDNQYQQVIILRYFQEMAIPDIAAELGLTPTQVYNRIHYGLRLLREHL